MNYKFGIVLKETGDYLRRADLQYMDFLKDQVVSLRMKFVTDSPSGIFYIEEDVNAHRTDIVKELLEANGYELFIVTAVRWKAFPAKPEISE